MLIGEFQYLDAMERLIAKGTIREDRTGTGAISLFGEQWRFDLNEGFPLLTTKKVYWKSVVAELLWILSGSTNINDLDATIWNEWADKDGNLGPVYGEQWRSWTTGYTFDLEGDKKVLREPIYFDQIKNLITNLIDKPNDRGHVVSAWNVAALPYMALRPCHCLFQFFVEDGKLSCQLYQRSADIFLGVPFNIASYALLTHMVAKEVGLEVGEFVHTFGDLHLYANHIEQAKTQIERWPRELPKLDIVDDRSIFHLDPSSFVLTGYDPHPAIKGKVSV